MTIADASRAATAYCERGSHATGLLQYIYSSRESWCGGSMSKTSPRDVPAEQTATFAADALRGRPRVLAIGSQGDLAENLSMQQVFGDRGFDVSAVGSADCTNLLVDLATVVRESFDAIVVTNVLHAWISLEQTLERIDQLLKPTGRLIVQDVDLAAPNDATLRWYYETLNKFAPPSPTSHLDPIARWKTERCSEPFLTGAELEAAIGSRFAVRSRNRVEYLYRDIAALLPASETGARTAHTIREIERHMIANEAIIAVGLQLVADRDSAADRSESGAKECGAKLADGIACVLPAGHDGLHRWRAEDGKTFDWG